ncbi:MAG: YceI family protein [Gemmatimonadales bacterium]
MTLLPRKFWIVALGLALPAVAAAQGQSSFRRARPTASYAARFELAPAGNVARFVAHEKLMVNIIENDAVGSTSAITGGLEVDAAGKIDPARSSFTVMLDSLRSDRATRDRYIKSHTLETDRYPVAELVVHQLRGLPRPLPIAGEVYFSLLGDMTMHGVTHPTTWQVTATAGAEGFAGTATTVVRFENFGMSPPHVPVVASVEDSIRLEYDFHLVRASQP